VAEYNHRQRLQEGPRPWNEWRASNPGVIPDLRYLELSLGQKQFGPINGGPIDLRSALLFKADLRNATLIEADLRDAELVEAEFGGARLDNADLRGAKLVDSSLIGADFSRAKLDGADLTGADLTSARNLSQQQINTAVGDITTQLPFDLVMPKSWIVPKARSGPQLPGDLPCEDAALKPSDLYEILGVQKTDSDETIHTVYRVKAKSLHPDLNPGSAGAEDAFRRLTYAYAILRDTDRRKRYDNGEIGTDGEETETYRYSVWRAARMRRLRGYAAVSLAITIISCGVILSQFTSLAPWLRGEANNGPAQEIAAPPPAQPNVMREASQSPVRSKIQSRMEAETDDLALPGGEDKNEQPVQDKPEPRQIDRDENISALKERSAGSTDQPDLAKPDESTPRPPEAIDAPAQPSSPSDIKQAALDTSQTAPTGDIARQEPFAPPLVLASPRSNALGPRLDRSLEPMPLIKLRMAPKFTILGLTLQPATPAPPRFVTCRSLATPGNASFDWVVKFRLGDSPCKPANFSPVNRSGAKQTRKTPAQNYQSRLQTDGQSEPKLPPVAPQKNPDISSDVLSGGL